MIKKVGNILSFSEVPCPDSIPVIGPTVNEEIVNGVFTSKNITIFLISRMFSSLLFPARSPFDRCR